MQFVTFARSLSLSAAVLLSAGAVFAPAAVILTTDDGFGADTFLSNDTNQSATSNFGAAGDMAVRRFDTVRAKLAYFKFDLSGVSGSLDGATLTLRYNSSNRVRTTNVYGLADNAIDDAWGEATITYANAPGIQQPANGGAAYNSGLASLDAAKLPLLTTYTSPGAGGTSVTTTADVDVDSFLAADTNDLVTFAVYMPASDSNASYFLASKENVGGVTVFPTLTLPNAVVPEPASAALVAAGALALLARRRHRRPA